MSTKTLPKHFAGRVQFEWNLWAFLRRLPKGFSVLFDFNDPMPQVGSYAYNGYMQVHFLPEIGLCCDGNGEVNFDQGTISFQTSDGHVIFTGQIDPSSTKISGVIRLKDVRDPHRIVFEAYKGD